MLMKYRNFHCGLSLENAIIELIFFFFQPSLLYCFRRPFPLSIKENHELQNRC
ncbi:hypothetical protein NEISUBOT_03052 [Neisseria subflava NJ9703]|uniref:Uncharacterized protein n=1 Tax=Neisseria subflava NJ9703 TaxID=546268 RepID=A0A9W5ISQ8_NEISU|nr:hypothetical protein NEISUBOT_03052 [Neisseria subflava NJ9703]